MSEYRARMTAAVRSLAQVAYEAELCTETEVDNVIDLYREQLSPRIGARLVARAWMDQDFRKWLLADATSVIRDWGYDGSGSSHPEFPALELKVVANSAEVHNLIVCTLCSCYPVALLGPQPTWYKSVEYRANAIRYPRALLRQFGLELPDDVRIDVWDSTANTRYLVLPLPPDGVNVDDSDAAPLEATVSRNMLIGTEV